MCGSFDLCHSAVRSCFAAERSLGDAALGAAVRPCWSATRALTWCAVLVGQVTDTFDIVLAGMKMSRFTLEMRTKYEVPVCSLYNSVFRTIITIAGRSIRMWSALDGTIVKEFKLISSSVR